MSSQISSSSELSTSSGGPSTSLEKNRYVNYKFKKRRMKWGVIKKFGDDKRMMICIYRDKTPWSEKFV